MEVGMSQLKQESVNKCFSLLREYIGEPRNGNKESAVLALDQLQAITAGSSFEGGRGCVGKPRVSGGAAE